MLPLFFPYTPEPDVKLWIRNKDLSIIKNQRSSRILRKETFKKGAAVAQEEEQVVR